MLQVAGTMFLQSYRAGKYYNYDRDGDKIAIDLILNSGMIGTTGVALDVLLLSLQPERNERLKNIMIARMNETITKIDPTHFVENQVLQLQFYG
jgi:hypothetical protein